MLKQKFSILLAATLGFLLTACSDNSTPQEGVKYRLLPTQLSQPSLAPVTEVFSLNCGHCATMETMLPEIETAIKQPIGKLHVIFNKSAHVGALIYYAAEMQLGHKPDSAMMADLFNAVQSPDFADSAERQRALEEAFNSRGLVSPYQFDEIQQKALFEVLTEAETISQQSQLNAVPTFIINGRYELITSGHKDVNDLAKTINYLLSQPTK